MLGEGLVIPHRYVMLRKASAGSCEHGNEPSGSTTDGEDY